MMTDNIDQYLRTTSRLRRRYTDSDGRLETITNGRYTRYAHLAALAAVKHLNFSPSLMPELRAAAVRAERTTK